MKPLKQQHKSNLKWVSDFIWNIADDRRRDIYVCSNCHAVNIAPIDYR